MFAERRDNSRTQGAAYREFSRQRYNELKKQMTHMRESEIVSRVIREWENMSTDQKNQFFHTKDTSMVMLNVGPLATPSKDAQGKLKDRTTGSKKEEVKEMNLEDVHIGEFQESSSQKPMKSRKISKRGNQSDYISFFKYHFDKLTREHRRWTSSQISSVVRLLWKKKKQDSGRLRKSSTLRSLKPKTGRKLFLEMQRPLTNSHAERQQKWKRLPRESRRMMNIEANPALEPKMDRTMTRSSMRFSQDGQNGVLNFLSSRMM